MTVLSKNEKYTYEMERGKPVEGSIKPAPELKDFYVSLSKDLLHVYIHFKAVSELAVRQYLQKEYLINGMWRLPWCSVYSSMERTDSEQAIVVKSQCGPLYEEKAV